MDVEGQFQVAVECFAWESEEQKKGYLAWIQYEGMFGHLPEPRIDTRMAFLIQKSHEAAEYWRDTFGEQIAMLQNDLKKLQEENLLLKERLGSFNSQLELSSSALAHLLRKP